MNDARPDLDLDGETVEPRLVPRSWAEISKHLPTREPLVDGLLDRGGFGVTYGASGARKSFFVFDLTAHLAVGWEWRGRAVKQSGVLLIAPDAGVGLRERMAAWAKHHKLDLEGVPLYVIAEPIDLCRSPNDADLVIEHIAKLAAVGIEVGLIVIDTLSRALAGGDENSPRDMGLFVHHCDRLRLATGAHVMAVHHAGKDESKGARGHSLLRSASDTEIEIIAHGETSIATVTKQRDHESGDAFAFRLISVEIGKGQASCVAEPVEIERHELKRAPHLSDRQRLALDALISLAAEHGEKLPASFQLPDRLRAVPIETWRAELYARGIIDKDGSNPRRAFADLRDALKRKALAAERDGLIWPIP